MSPHIVACVTVQRQCESIILAAAQLARQMKGQLSVVHVARPGSPILGNPHEGEVLQYLYELSKLHEAEMTVLRADNTEEALADYLLHTGTQNVVLGTSRQGGEHSFVSKLRARLPEVHFQVEEG